MIVHSFCITDRFDICFLLRYRYEERCDEIFLLLIK